MNAIEKNTQMDGKNCIKFVNYTNEATHLTFTDGTGFVRRKFFIEFFKCRVAFILVLDNYLYLKRSNFCIIYTGGEMDFIYGWRDGLI